MARPRIEGYAIVSADGMLADAGGTMPPALYIDADQAFFARALDAVDVVIHGRHSREDHPNSARRRRILVTGAADAIAADPGDPLVRLWNPAGASRDDLWRALALVDGTVAVIGGTDVFGMFLSDYDAFHLSRAASVSLPGGRPIFPGVPEQTPEDVLAAAGLTPGPPKLLDTAAAATVTTWRRDR